jgi:NADPH:quinone reductase-like Zn-dependent oxidoreductase
MSQAYKITPNDPSKSHLSPTFLDNLQLTTIPIPVPGPKEVLIRIRAVALNYRDLLIVADSPLYPKRTLPGLTPCCDASGEIISTGTSSKWSSSIDLPVILAAAESWIDGDVSNYEFETTVGMGDRQGFLQQYVVVGDEWIVKAPKNLSWEERASLPCAGATAWNVLSSISVGQDTTVVSMGTGGVSCYVIQVSSSIPSVSLFSSHRSKAM